METIPEVELGFDLKQLMVGLSHSGYTPVSALFDIVDNAVQAGAANVRVFVRKEDERYNDKRKNNVAAYEVVDDGAGMDAAGMARALSLAAGGAPYPPGSLSKFGLGLKAAAQSQGDELHLISSPGGEVPFTKYVVAFDAVRPDRYFATAPPLSEADAALVAEHLPEGRGTVVRIARVRKGGHPSLKATVAEMHSRAGVIYYYALHDGLTLTIYGKPVAAVDVLATDEADANGNLDESEWDGQTVRWIKRPGMVALDTEQGVQAAVEVTQLPYPPVFDLDTPGGRDATQKRYGIEAGNYGYYVYRNKRLIAWAESFDGIVPNNQKLFSFRGRIHIDETADEAFNIDLKKARIMLSDEARETLAGLSSEYKAKSIKAWLTAGSKLKQRTGGDPNKDSNALADGYDEPTTEAEDTATPEEAREQEQREKEVADADERRMREEAARARQAATGQPVSPDTVTPDEVFEAVRGTANPSASRIFRVERVDDNTLWEPYFDAEHGASVRINAQHRFGRVLFEDNAGNAGLQVLVELMLLTMAQAEVSVKTQSRLPLADAERLLGDYRRAVSAYLAKLCLDVGEQLPKQATALSD